MVFAKWIVKVTKNAFVGLNRGFKKPGNIFIRRKSDCVTCFSLFEKNKNNKDPLLINFSVLFTGVRLAPKETTVN